MVRRILMLGAVAVGAVTLVGAALVPVAAQNPADGTAPLIIEKEVEGDVPEGTEFVVKVECVGLGMMMMGAGAANGGAIPIIHTPNGPVASATVDFDEDGEPDGPDTITFDGPGTCTVTETDDGDAEDVSYECEGQIPLNGAANGEFGTAGNGILDPCESKGPQDDPMTVFIEAPDQTATVTVINEFDDPGPPAPAAQPVVVEPTFTG